VECGGWIRFLSRTDKPYDWLAGWLVHDSASQYLVPPLSLCSALASHSSRPSKCLRERIVTLEDRERGNRGEEGGRGKESPTPSSFVSCRYCIVKCIHL